MRVAVLSWESRYSMPCGGLAEHVTELGAALSRRGHDVHVLSRIGPGQSIYECIDGVHYHRCPSESGRDLVTTADRMCDSLFNRPHTIEAAFGRPFDIVHAHDWLCVKALAKAKNGLGRPAVFTLHSTEYGRCGNQLINGQSQQVREIEWEGTCVADRIICVSKALQREVQWLHSVRPDKTRAIYNGVDVRRFDATVDEQAVRQRIAVGVDDPMILFAGRLAWQKGPDLLVESIPGLLHYYPTAKFVFAGDGDMRPGLESRTSDLEVGRATRFLGYRTGTELIDLFKTADIVCVPSRNEPFGIVILEAWSAARPVVVTRNGGPGEFVRHNDTGCVVSDDRDSIGWGLGTTLAEREQASGWGRNGRVEAETLFTWDLIAGETESVYVACAA
jgi:glycosyltransferase involved in cell wall biosynthesis